MVAKKTTRKTPAAPAEPAARAPSSKSTSASPKAARSSKAEPAEAGPAQGEAPASLAPGQPAPPFTLPSDDGAQVSLEALRGKRVVLYFYPKDNTPGCTREACSFQASLASLARKGAVVLGVSRDSPKTHAGFKQKQGLSFPLLSDPDASVHRAYGAWGTKVMYGRAVEGCLRTTVLIDRDGKVARVFPSVKVDGHAEQVLEALSQVP